MKTRHVIAILAASAAFVGWLENPAHSAESENIARNIGTMVRATKVCDIRFNEIAGVFVANELNTMTPVQVELALEGARAFNERVDMTGKTTACNFVLENFSSLVVRD